MDFAAVFEYIFCNPLLPYIRELAYKQGGTGKYASLRPQRPLNEHALGDGGVGLSAILGYYLYRNAAQ